MRVITGIARGTRLLTPDNMDIRPTSDMAKEAIFSILQNDLQDAKVLDLFAGSGQLGIEALSRGASLCVFVDKSRAAQELVKENLQRAKLAPLSRVVAMEFASYLKHTKDKFDIVLLDPPYSKGILDEALPMVEPVMEDTGIILCEVERNDMLPETVGRFSVFKEYRYGKAKVVVYKLAQ